MSVELKIRALSAKEIAQATDGTVVQTATADRPVRYVSTDSRDVGEDILFFALRGERFDGHAFAATAVSNGATCLVCSVLPDSLRGADVTVILVEDTTRALGALASYYRSLSDAKIVAVTGSVGKTTTKELIASVLSARFSTHKTEGNFNNHIGLPLTLFALAPHHQLAVLEMGMSARGEIAYLSRIAKPDMAVITNVGTSHLEHLGTRENIAEAKMEIMEGLSPEGFLVINGDEPLLTVAGSRFPHTLRVSTSDPGADCYADRIALTASDVSFVCKDRSGACSTFRTPIPGAHNVYNTLFACAIGFRLGMNQTEIQAGLSAYRGVAMRQNIYTLDGITIIEDCYNASPESMRASIDVLTAMAKESSCRATALLGDMLELGESSPALHESVGCYAFDHGVEKLFAFGERAGFYASGAVRGGMDPTDICSVEDRNDVKGMADALENALRPGDVLLVKASRGVAAERILAELKARKEIKTDE